MSTPFDVAADSAPPFLIPSDSSCPPQCTKDRILRAAQNLFYQHGIRAVSVDAIAAEAETTKVTLYRLFDSKDALVAACLEDQTRRFWGWWDMTVKPHEGNPRAQIEALFSLLEHRICAKATNRGCPITNTAVEVDQDHPAARIIREHHDEIARRFRALCKEMGARRPDALGDALTLLVSGAFSARCVFESTEHLDTIGEAARALLDSALGAPGK
jgi:AcrR family transcriptional regulator